jgi:Zn ribbon nucleic-acid-binding protein
VIGRNTGFRCPQCEAPSTWEVFECGACGFRTDASRGWEREARRKARWEERQGCLSVLFDASFWIDGVFELALWAGRGLWLVLRGIWSAWH